MLYRTLYVGVLWLLSWSIQTTAQPLAKPGIQFLSGSFLAAEARAKAAHKSLFVEVFLTGCPHCQALAPILVEKAVGDFYNANFISWQVEANAAESVALQKAKGLTYPEFPLFLFFDADGTLIHVSTPAEQASKQAFIEEVIQQGRTALTPTQRTSGYGPRFEAGERDIAFLIRYGKYCKTRKDSDRLHQISEALGQALQSGEQVKSPVGFYCLQRLIDEVDNPAAAYFFGHLSEFTALYPVKEVKEAGEGIVFRALYGPKGDTYPVAKIEQMRAYMVGLGVPAGEAASRTLLKELGAYLRAGDTPGAVARFNAYRKEVSSLGVAGYAYLMHYFNQQATDSTYLDQMPLWAADGLKSVPANQPLTKQVADLHYELAIAYQKLGQKADALKQAQQALIIAKQAKVDLTIYETQLRSLQ